MGLVDVHCHLLFEHLQRLLAELVLVLQLLHRALSLILERLFAAHLFSL